VLKPDNRLLSEAKELRPQSQEALYPSNDFADLIAVVGLRGGSKVTGGLSVRRLANVTVRDSIDDFTFIVSRRRYWCPSSVAEFLSPRVYHLHCIDATIDELRLEVRDPDKVFQLVLNVEKDSAFQLI
jgi:hypothetical protein